MLREAALVALAGALGTLARYGVGIWLGPVLAGRFPWPTLLVNVAGSFAIGLVLELALASPLVPPAARVAVATGFLGAFTTFSTFSYDTVRMLQQGAWAMAAANATGSLCLCFVATALGIGVARAVV